MNHFPIPYPGELLYGIVGRYVRANGFATFEHALFNGYRLRVTRRHPLAITPLLLLAQQVDYPNREAIVQWLIGSHSLHSYVCPFIRPEKSSLLSTPIAARARSGGVPNFLVSLIGRRRTVPIMFRGCSLCFEDDRRSVGEPFWHRDAFLPNAVVCAKHQCWLSAWHIQHDQVIAVPDELVDVSRAISGPRHVPPTSLFELAALDATVMSTGSLSGLITRRLAALLENRRAKCADSSHFSRAVSVGGLMNYRLGKHALMFSDLRFTTIAQRPVSEVLQRLKSNRAMCAADAVLAAWLLGVSAAEWVELLVDADDSAGSDLLEVCGGRYCNAYSPDWREQMHVALDDGVSLVRARCRKCKFSASLVAKTGTIRPGFSGTSTLATRKSLLSDTKLTRRDIAHILGNTALTTRDYRFQRKYHSSAFLRDAAILVVKQKTSARKRRRSPAVKGSIDGPAFLVNVRWNNTSKHESREPSE